MCGYLAISYQCVCSLEIESECRKFLLYFLYLYNIYARASIKALHIKMYADKTGASCLPKEYR
ncbi:hypothetical protein ccbrp13_09880 [Ktedonobacteria bacterium brp13]|nr:hypothetical protein ccbrp13_09880 [Ktedonobacteria bacterium brp13]